MAKIKDAVFAVVFYFYKTILKPKSDDIDIRRKELILNILLLNLMVLTIVGISLVIYGQILLKANYHGTSLTLMTLVLLSLVFLIILSRKGYILFSSYVLIGLFFLFSTWAGYRWGVDLPSNLLSYALLVLISSILINTRFGFIIFFLVGTILLSFSYLETKHLYLPERTWQLAKFTIDDAIEYAVIIFIITSVSWLSNRETEKSLVRAQMSERQLQYERDGLEVTVAERTKELREAQIEKITNLYRFVEFGRLSTGLFHDLMSPLTSISISLEQFQQTNQSGEDLKKQTAAALKSSRRMNDLLLHARNHIRIPDKEINFNIIEEIKLAIDLLSSKWKKADVNITIDDNKEIRTFGNPVMFNHIMTNLISNAIDAFTEVLSRNKKITIEIKDDSKSILIKVIDFGCGIPLEIISHVFDPFFTTKDNTTGIGIGLSASKHSLEKYFHGSINVTSNPETGTTFFVEIPKQPNQSLKNFIKN